MEKLPIPLICLTLSHGIDDMEVVESYLADPYTGPIARKCIPRILHDLFQEYSAPQVPFLTSRQVLNALQLLWMKSYSAGVLKSAAENNLSFMIPYLTKLHIYDHNALQNALLIAIKNDNMAAINALIAAGAVVESYGGALATAVVPGNAQIITGDKVQPFFADLRRIWRTHLYPLIAEPEIEAILKRIIEPRLQALRNGLTHALGYFHYDRKVLDDLLSQEKPWLKYPLVMLSYVADPEEYKESLLEPNVFRGILLNWQRFVTAMTDAKSPEDIEWWILLHDCGMVNGVFLFHLLKKAFPYSTFKVLTSSLAHVWIQDEKGENLDLYWPSVGIDIREALYDENGIPVTIEVSDVESTGC